VTNIDGISEEIQRLLRSYSQGVIEQLETDKKEIATALKNHLRNESPKATGDYRKGWAIKKSGKKYIVHNKTDYQLTHLLEHGHIKRGGGDRVEPRVHIAPAEERYVGEFLERVERTIKGE
jgi:hypothetical protein